MMYRRDSPPGANWSIALSSTIWCLLIIMFFSMISTVVFLMMGHEWYRWALWVWTGAASYCCLLIIIGWRIECRRANARKHHDC